jgi:REP element-mobilizing transposase RayT
MARAQRIEYEGAVYHVTARGNERRAIFQDDTDRERFLHTLAESVERFEVRLYLFCLMSNHIHLVVETPRANLGPFMHRLLTSYTVYFNRRHRRCGHLMQGRYGARLVEKDAYMLRLSRYVHLNPVFTAGARRRPLCERVTMLRQYRWSSYRSYIGSDRRIGFVDYAPILALVSPGGTRPAQAYRRFVEAGIETVDEILAVVSKRLGVDRAVLLQRRRNSFNRAIASRMLCDHGGLTQRRVAEVLHIRTGAPISQQLRKLARELQSNRPLRNQVTEIAEELKQRRDNH